MRLVRVDKYGKDHLLERLGGERPWAYSKCGRRLFTMTVTPEDYTLDQARQRFDLCKKCERVAKRTLKREEM